MNALIPDQSRLLDALMRRDFASFVRKVFHTLNPGSEYQDNWHIRAMCNALEEDWHAYSQGGVTDTGETAGTRRLLITVPPRHLKSITVSVAFPAWVLGHDPSKKFLVVSYGGDLALRHARDFRRVVQSGWYQALFPGFGRIARDTAEEVVTSAGGGRLSASVGGALTGLGADIIVIDDLMKASDANSVVERKKVQDFYEGSLVSRLNAKTAYMMVAIQQRLHEDDLAGYLLDKGSFRHLNLPAIAPEDRIYELGKGGVNSMPAERHCSRRGNRSVHWRICAPNWVQSSSPANICKTPRHPKVGWFGGSASKPTTLRQTGRSARLWCKAGIRR